MKTRYIHLKHHLKKIKWVKKTHMYFKLLYFKFSIFKDRIFYRTLKDNPIWIRTSDIGLILDVPIRSYKNKLLKKTGIVYKGNKFMNYEDWDLQVKNFNENRTFRSAKQVYIENKEWPETEIYKKILKNIESGKIMQECGTKKELDKHFYNTDKLYKQIKQKGYRSQQELKSLLPNDEVRVAIGRNREIIFLDGRHRLSIAKVLEIETIPVFICIIHPKAFTKDPSEILNTIRV